MIGGALCGLGVALCGLASGDTLCNRLRSGARRRAHASAPMNGFYGVRKFGAMVLGWEQCLLY